MWNKLGNLYLAGARPELAMVAFERSIVIDSNQMESHLSTAKILLYVEDYQHTIYHLHQMMLSAEHYEHLDANRLRELVRMESVKFSLLRLNRNRSIHRFLRESK